MLFALIPPYSVLLTLHPLPTHSLHPFTTNSFDLHGTHGAPVYKSWQGKELRRVPWSDGDGARHGTRNTE